MRALGILLALGFVTFLCSSGALAVDGVNEINHTSIVAAGGYPYSIAAKGSYRLTGDLTPPGGTPALVAGADNIEIDLNGFTIVSPGGGAVNGIDSAGFSGLVVRNGVVHGFGGAGIVAGSDSKVIETKLTGNGSGISGASNCLIVMNTIAGNTSNGVSSASVCKIENNAIAGNSGAGISGSGNVIANNRIGGNGGGGILEFGGSTIQQNELDGNVGFGISDGAPPGPAPVPPPPAPPRTNITGNTISATAPGGAVGGRGISFLLPVSVTNNVISGSFANGVFCGAGCLVNGNSVNQNNTGGVAGAGGVNVAAGSTVSGNSISYNTGFGLTLPAPATASYTNNTIVGNAPGPNVISPPTITGGFGNVCAPAACP